MPELSARKEWGWVALGGLAVYLWMKSNQSATGRMDLGPFTGGGTVQLPIFAPAAIDPTTGSPIVQEEPIPGTPLSGVPNVNPGQTPLGGDGTVPNLMSPTPGGGALPVVSGQPGTPGGPLLLNP